MNQPVHQHHLPVAESRDVRRAAARLIKEQWRGYGTALLINCAAAAAGLAAPWLVGRIVDGITKGADGATLATYAALMMVAALLQLLLLRYANKLSNEVGERTQATIRERYVERVFALPPDRVERAGVGDLVARGTGDITAVGATLRDAGPAVLIATLQIAFIIGVVLFINPLLGLCGLVGVVGIGIALRWYLRRARTDYLAQGAASSALAEQLAASATGARTVEAPGLQEHRLQVCEQAIADSSLAQHRTLFLRSVLYPSVDVSTVVPVVLVLLLGLALSQQGILSLGTVVAVALYMHQLGRPVATLLEWVETLQGATASFARVEGLGLAAVTASPGQAAEPVDERLEAARLSYAYDGGPDVVAEVTLGVAPGERLAIVGASGAGKTTLARLLAGHYAPSRGTVTLGGAAISALPDEQLRRQVQFVTQEQHVFMGTIAENLRLASPDAAPSELLRALDAVGAGWIERLPDGVDTVLDGTGHTLEPAHIQQLALARVVLADPHTIILDEATSLLDPAVARDTERALAGVLAGRTIISIAHRLQTARDADRVAMMADGRITEIGSHAELMARRGSYAALWEAWSGE